VVHADDSHEQRWTHARVQWLLLDLGRRTGHDVWVAIGDRDRMVGAVRLGDVSLEQIPTTLPLPARRIMEHIDVVWFPHGTSQPSRLFEVEHSTSIVTGLLRMSDLLVSVTPAKIGWRTHIVAPARRLSKFETERTRPTFRATGLIDSCTFMSYDQVLEEHQRCVGSGIRF
jgi:type II restriction enzyme